MSPFPSRIRRALLCALLAAFIAQLHAAVGDGFWHTDGNQIKDVAGNVVRFSGVNWGGSWVSLSGYLRLSYRDMYPPNRKGSDLGFRLAQDIP